MSYPSAPEWAMNIRCLTTGGVLPVRVSKAPPPVLLARDQERSICVGAIRLQDLIKDNFALRLIRVSPASAASRRMQESAGCCLRLQAWSPILGPTRCHTAFLPNHAGNRCAIASTPSRMRGPRPIERRASFDALWRHPRGQPGAGSSPEREKESRTAGTPSRFEFIDDYRFVCRVLEQRPFSRLLRLSRPRKRASSKALLRLWIPACARMTRRPAGTQSEGALLQRWTTPAPRHDRAALQVCWPSPFGCGCGAVSKVSGQPEHEGLHELRYALAI